MSPIHSFPLYILMILKIHHVSLENSYCDFVFEYTLVYKHPYQLFIRSAMESFYFLRALYFCFESNIMYYKSLWKLLIVHFSFHTCIKVNMHLWCTPFLCHNS